MKQASQAGAAVPTPLSSGEIRSRFLRFFEKRGHAVLPSASLVATDEKGVTDATLFNTAGMQPLIPYLLGKPHPLGKRLVNAQKCLRTIDIDDVGDKTHATFFEMLGNWSLGDYFKQQAIEWSYEFLTSTSGAAGDQGLGLDPQRLYVTVFEGDANAPRDEEAADIWRQIFKKHGIEGNRIFYMPASMNWWEAGDNGPCGPDTEMYYDIGPDGGKFRGQGITHEQFVKADASRDIVEVWNDVFMQYEKRAGKITGNLPKPSVDTGAGLERLAMTLQGVDNIYETDLLKPFLRKLRGEVDVTNYDEKSARIILDHTRAAAFLIADGVIPGNTGRGYVLRKLIRRAVDNIRELNIKPYDKALSELAQDFVKSYSDSYPNLALIDSKKILSPEVNGYVDALRGGIQRILHTPDLMSYSSEHMANFLFDLHQSEGLPLAVAIDEIYKNYKLKVSEETEEIIKKLENRHQSLSRSGAEQKFKGGLADANDPMVVRYHTATHLLHQALHDVLGEDSARQKGSNITPERLRFDFSYGAKMTDAQKERVEKIVNDKIAASLPVNNVVMSRAEAEKTGARHFFGEKYGDQISVYFIGKDLAAAYSKEFCGGPHVKNTSELAGPEGKWRFKIQKEEAVSAGVRRIKAVLA